MSKRFIIEGGIVRCEDIQTTFQGTVTTVEGSVSVAQFVAKLGERANHTIFMPRLHFGYVIAQVKSNNLERYIIEQRPMVVKITEKVDDQRHVNERSIALPYVYYCVTINSGSFHELHVFFCKDRIKTENDVLGECPMPNQHSGGNVCMGSDVDTFLGGITDIATICDTATQSFWSTTFNYDILHHWENAKSNISTFPKSFQEWAQITQDPFRRNRIIAIDWLSSRKTIASLLAFRD